MTALSIALVLCCAMVCGTRIYLRRLTARSEDVSTLGYRIDAVTTTSATQAEVLKALRSDVDTLKARDALGGM